MISWGALMGEAAFCLYKLPVQTEKRTMVACQACALCLWPSSSALLRASLHAHCLKSTKRFNGRDSDLPEQKNKRTSIACSAGGLCLCAAPCAVKLTCRTDFVTPKHGTGDLKFAQHAASSAKLVSIDNNRKHGSSSLTAITLLPSQHARHLNTGRRAGEA